MKTKGIRISDIKDGKCIPLGELLETIPDETQFFWAGLWQGFLIKIPLQGHLKYS